MLKEEQVRELLIECERLVEQPLVKIRGNLTKSENRSAAIFELVAIQVFAALGKLEYEPLNNSPQHFLSEEYRVENCSLIPADAKTGEGAKVKLDFVLDHNAIFERLSKSKRI